MPWVRTQSIISRSYNLILKFILQELRQRQNVSFVVMISCASSAFSRKFEVFISKVKHQQISLKQQVNIYRLDLDFYKGSSLITLSRGLFLCSTFFCPISSLYCVVQLGTKKSKLLTSILVNYCQQLLHLTGVSPSKFQPTLLEIYKAHATWCSPVVLTGAHWCSFSSARSVPYIVLKVDS